MKIKQYTNAHDLASDIAKEMTRQFADSKFVEFDYDRFEKPGDIRFLFILEGLEIELYYSTLVERYETIEDFVKAFKNATTR
ncbi:MAG TPA: hypothetical protein VJ824_06260 [Bacillota bacterium]|nr:hypothetical protein [Bacillota bacterium]